VSLGGQRLYGGVQHLVVVDDGEHRHSGVEQGQGRVVVPAALTQPGAEGVDGEGGHEDDVGAEHPGHTEGAPAGLTTAAAGAGAQVVAAVPGPLEIAAAHQWQHHGDALVAQRPAQWRRLGLRAGRGVEGDAPRRLDLRQLEGNADEPAGDLGPLGRPTQPPHGADATPKGGLHRRRIGQDLRKARHDAGAVGHDTP